MPALWYLIIGAVLTLMALSSAVLQRLPLNTAMVYLAIGIAIGPLGLGLLRIDPVQHAAILERITEIAVIVSLFTAGLKLRLPLSDPRWHIPIRLAVVSMSIFIGLVAVVGVVGLGLPLGAAILLGAILAPTDPVLASEVQVKDERDADRLRFSLTGEAGLNDGTAFPLVMLGLGLLGLRDLGPQGLRWLTVDLFWAVAAGLGIGALLGTLVGQLVLYLRRHHHQAVGLDDFLALGLLALAYGAGLLLGAYGFLAAFAAGLALRRVEREATGDDRPPSEQLEHAEVKDPAIHPELAPAYLAQEVLAFNERLDRMGEVAVVLLVGALVTAHPLSLEEWWFVPVVLFGIRPLAVMLGLWRSEASLHERWLIGWFGIRGVGSVYYLALAIQLGLAPELTGGLASLVLTVILVSIIVHGISVTPLMERYRRTMENRA